MPVRIQWRVSNCGGPCVFGSQECGEGSVLPKNCKCTQRIDHNYALWFVLAQCMLQAESKPHTFLDNEKGITDAFSSLVIPFFNQPLIQNAGYRTVDGGQLKAQWNQMVVDYETRNALNDASAGYETHPVETPYDEQMRDLILERPYMCMHIPLGNSID